VKRHVDAWLSEPELSGPGAFAEMRDRIRDMNQETSQEVFVGPYLPAELRAEFGGHYRNMTDGFLSLPLPLPGTAVWRGMQSRKAVIRILEGCAAQSKARLAAGGTPACLLDFWTEYLNGECAAAAARGELPPKHAGNHEIADVMMDFLFASQDASTASLTWLAALLCDHPDVLARVRAEQAAVRPDLSKPLDGDTLYQMSYTRQVVKETLRYRPVAPMVPQLAAVNFPLADGVVAPKGSLVIPSLMAAVWSGQGFPKGDMFDPDRMGPDRAEDVKHAKHFLTFGCGPHACVGIQYATNHLVAFAARLAASVELSRQRTSNSDDFLYLPTVYPLDCLLHMEPREQHAR
jgi:cytochrome P450 family 710 subfamily A protein